ncbi:hypothetical protein BH10ACT11_BH10ACT11_17200 [soil metagenome]
MRSKRWILIVTTVLAAAMLASLARAAGGPPDNQYEGRLEKDSATYFGFDLSKSGGKTKVTKVKVGVIYHCRSGEGGFLLGKSRGSLPVRSNDTFSGKLKVRFARSTRGSDGFSHATYAVHGKLGKKGKAAGTFEGELDFTPVIMARGIRQDHCYTGGLDWKAKRGADVSVSPTPVRGGIR